MGCQAEGFKPSRGRRRPGANECTTRLSRRPTGRIGETLPHHFWRLDEGTGGWQRTPETEGWCEVSSGGDFDVESSNDRKWYTLYDKVYARENLEQAWKKVKANRGKPGWDRESIDQFAENWLANLGEIHRLLKEKRYTPPPVLRVNIPKEVDNQGKVLKFRPLGVPTVRDRVAQQAVVQVARSSRRCSATAIPGTDRGVARIRRSHRFASITKRDIAGWSMPTSRTSSGRWIMTC